MQLKAKLIRYIPLATATLFFLANLYLKQGIGYVYVMVDFIYMGILELQGAEARITKLKFLVHSRIRTHDPLIVKSPS